MDSTLLDVVIGLGFVFFVFSLVVSGINELVRKALNTRAKALWKALSQILDDGRNAFQPKTAGVSLPDAPKQAKSPENAAVGLAARQRPLAFQIYDHPLVARLDVARPGNQSRIHHIPPQDFARALIDILTPREGDEATPAWDKIGDKINTLPEPLRSQFLLLYHEAGSTIVEFRKAIESWFDTNMQRVSDWYKKRTRWVLAVYGIAVAAIFNVSAISVTAELYENDIVRDAVVSLAQRESVAIDPIGDCSNRACIEEKVSTLIDTGLPIGWRECPEPGTTDTSVCGFEAGDRAIVSIVGWAITAAAISMGGSFWFTLLKRAIGLRQQQQSV